MTPARLTDEVGNQLSESVVSSGESSASAAGSGTLPPGDYRLQLEASAGFGFGAAASDTSGSAAFDVTFRLTLPGADADADALPDEWETDGVDVDDDSTIDLDLPGMGADPRRKDIFVELDFMPPHGFASGAGNQIAKAFADAPVNDPDGTPGITLHLDNGAGPVQRHLDRRPALPISRGRRGGPGRRKPPCERTACDSGSPTRPSERRPHRAPCRPA